MLPITLSFRKNRRIYLILSMLLLLIFSISLIASTPRPPGDFPQEATARTSDEPIAPQLPGSYPPDPTSDIPWSAGYSGVADIQAAFNNARDVENTQLGLSIPHMTLPSSTWNTMSNSEKAFWLINRERIDRGVKQMDGVESNVISVAQNYAQYLLDNNAFSHTADGHDPWWRLDQNAAIGACHDWLAIAENLAVFWQSGGSVPLPIERAVYMWMYEDSGSMWGHRHAMLWYPYTENGGASNKEGFLGIGLASGPHFGWPVGVIIVMNVFDPCASWVYGGGVVPLPPDLWLPLVVRD